MLTVKLQSKAVTKIVECASVDINVVSAVLTTVTTKAPDGTAELFFVVKPGCENQIMPMQNSHGADPLYHVAFVENAAGSTTQVVRA